MYTPSEYLSQLTTDTPRYTLNATGWCWMDMLARKVEVLKNELAAISERAVDGTLSTDDTEQVRLCVFHYITKSQHAFGQLEQHFDREETSNIDSLDTKSPARAPVEVYSLFDSIKKFEAVVSNPVNDTEMSIALTSLQQDIIGHTASLLKKIDSGTLISNKE